MMFHGGRKKRSFLSVLPLALIHAREKELHFKGAGDVAAVPKITFR
jgi:hypothetical protein